MSKASSNPASMAKKPKSENPNSSNSASSDNIFKSSFGGTQEEPNNPTPISIFSDSNPFRRKPTDDSQSIPQKLQQVLQLDADCSQIIDTQITDSADNQSNKRKRKEKLADSIDSNDSDIEGEAKKLKIENGVVSESSKSSKRKRQEVEVEYEELKYGGSSSNLKEVEGKNVKIGEKRKKLDQGDDFLVSKEGFDDEEKLLRTVIVGNLPLKVKKKALLREFGQFGDIESVRLRSIPLFDDKTPIIKKQINDAVDRVNAYIVFNTEESAQASLLHNMAVVGGNHIHVDRACPPRKKLKGENASLYDSKRMVFMSNLPFDVKVEELYQLFTGVHNLKDDIEAIHVVRDPGMSVGNGVAYVLFKTQEAANTVFRKHKMKIRDTELRLSRVIKSNSNPTSSKRKNPPSSNEYNSSNKKLAVAVGGMKRMPESCAAEGDNRNKKARKL